MSGVLTRPRKKPQVNKLHAQATPKNVLTQVGGAEHALRIHGHSARFEQSEFMSLISKWSAQAAMEQYARDVADLETSPAATPFGERLYDQVLSHWIQGRRPAQHYPNSN